jgi:hypothetical protein
MARTLAHGWCPRNRFTRVRVGRKTGSEAGEAIPWGHFVSRGSGYLWWALRLDGCGVWWSQRTAPQPVTSFELNWRKCRAARLTPSAGMPRVHTLRLIRGRRCRGTGCGRIEARIAEAGH